MRFLLFLFGFFVLHLAAAPIALADTKNLTCEERWSDLGGKSLVRSVTTNTSHFWAWARENATSRLGPYLKPEGQVMGDTHLRNVFDYRAGPREAPKLAVADLDDGGRGPLFLDFARYLVFVKAADIDLKAGELFSAYVAGLKGEAHSAPELIREAAELSAEDIKKRHLKYLEKNTRRGKFSDDLELTPLTSMTRAQVADSEVLGKVVLKMTGEKKIFDVGFTTTDSGSSAGQPRFWFLVGDESGPKQIIEAKGMGDPALSAWKSQPGHQARVRGLLAAYTPGLDPSLFGVTQVSGHSYWLRPRKYQALDLNGNSVTEAQQSEFALYLANWMGQMQRAQPEGASLLSKIQEDEYAAKEAVKIFVQDYLKTIKSF